MFWYYFIPSDETLKDSFDEKNVEDDFILGFNEIPKLEENAN